MKTERIAALGAAGAALSVAAALWMHGDAADGWQAATRWTARFALIPFVIVFAAMPLMRHARGTMLGILRNRRGLGLAFAAAHFIHAGTFVTWYVLTGRWPTVVTLVGGGLAYAFILAMALTSTDAARRAMGRWWTHLHRWGLRYVWLIFFNSYLGRIVEGGDRVGVGVFGVTLLLGAAALRLSLVLRQRASAA